jgi:hypothetical protein
LEKEFASQHFQQVPGRSMAGTEHIKERQNTTDAIFPAFIFKNIQLFEHLNWLKATVVFMLAVSVVGTIFTGGQLQGVFLQLLVLLVVFLLIVELAPQLIVADEKKTPHEAS